MGQESSTRRFPSGAAPPRRPAASRSLAIPTDLARRCEALSQAASAAQRAPADIGLWREKVAAVAAVAAYRARTPAELKAKVAVALLTEFLERSWSGAADRLRVGRLDEVGSAEAIFVSVIDDILALGVPGAC